MNENHKCVVSNLSDNDCQSPFSISLLISFEMRVSSGAITSHV